VTRRNEVLVGATIILSIALIVWGTIWLKGAGFGREENVIRARVSEAGQLLKGGAVKLRGVPIGRVSGNRARAELGRRDCDDECRRQSAPA
jgi:ABC-type transporter Mla subunit MlaD